MKPSNILRTSIAMSICLGLLAACQDRGAFKARTYTPDQIAANKLAKAEADAKAHPQGPAPLPDTNNGGGKDDKNSGAGGGDTKLGPDGKPIIPKGGPTDTPAKPVSPEVVAAQVDTQFKSGKGAQNKTIIEPAARESVIKDIRSLMATKSDEAIATILGIDINIPTDQKDTPPVSIDAVILLNGEQVIMRVDAQKLSMENNDKVTPFPVTLTRKVPKVGQDALVTDEDAVIAAGLCAESCDEVLVRISVKTDSGRVYAVFTSTPNGPTYKIDDSNLKDGLKRFDGGLAGEDPIKKDDKTKTGSDPATPPAPGAADPAAGPAADGKGDKLNSDGTKADPAKTADGTTVVPGAAPAAGTPAVPLQHPISKPMKLSGDAAPAAPTTPAAPAVGAAGATGKVAAPSKLAGIKKDKAPTVTKVDPKASPASGPHENAAPGPNSKATTTVKPLAHPGQTDAATKAAAAKQGATQPAAPGPVSGAATTVKPLAHPGQTDAATKAAADKQNVPASAFRQKLKEANAKPFDFAAAANQAKAQPGNLAAAATTTATPTFRQKVAELNAKPTDFAAAAKNAEAVAKGNAFQAKVAELKAKPIDFSTPNTQVATATPAPAPAAPAARPAQPVAAAAATTTAPGPIPPAKTMTAQPAPTPTFRQKLDELKSKASDLFSVPATSAPATTAVKPLAHPGQTDAATAAAKKKADADAAAKKQADDDKAKALGLTNI